eukprot:363784-Chlamydomonas_euryale.AAC.13
MMNRSPAARKVWVWGAAWGLLVAWLGSWFLLGPGNEDHCESQRIRPAPSTLLLGSTTSSLSHTPPGACNLPCTRYPSRALLIPHPHVFPPISPGDAAGALHERARRLALLRGVCNLGNLGRRIPSVARRRRLW